ncbi:ABC transporter permease [Streptomyces sp. NPDC048442]|uniref:ABC transporter permease n=1 Tax=Streptomyces sp. NPDC048442 TaxID=3154823 RepID=UPI003434C025
MKSDRQCADGTGAAPAVDVSFRAVLRAEWARVRSVRPVRWALPLSAVLLVAVGAGVCASVGAAASGTEDFDPVRLGYYGLCFAHVLVIAFAVLVADNDCPSLAGRTSSSSSAAREPALRAGPRYGARLITVAVLALAAGAVASAGTFFLSQYLLGAHGISFGEEGTVRAVVSGALYFPLLAVMCTGAASMLRSRPLSLGLLVPALYLVSPVLSVIPGIREPAWYLPDRAGQYALRIHLDPAAPYGPVTGSLILALWAAAAAVGGWLVLRGRDA